jgi:hypothetical protein
MSIAGPTARQGITNIDTPRRNGRVVASFPAHQGEQLMLVTDQGNDPHHRSRHSYRGPEHDGRDHRRCRTSTS